MSPTLSTLRRKADLLHAMKPGQVRADKGEVAKHEIADDFARGCGTALVCSCAGRRPRPRHSRIIDEGMNHSQLLLTASQLMDEIGPRLTNSHNLRKAEEWALNKFRSYGLTNVHREPFDFGRGWNFTTSSARMIEPRPIDMVEIPVAWTPGTNGRDPCADHRRADEQGRAFRGLARKAGREDRPSNASGYRAMSRRTRRSSD